MAQKKKDTSNLEFKEWKYIKVCMSIKNKHFDFLKSALGKREISSKVEQNEAVNVSIRRLY